MPALRYNILANYAGQIWMALMGVIFIPLYVRFLGMEAFGLVGLMLSIQALSMLLDLGMGGALNRELARRAHDVHLADSLGDLVRTFEWLIWPMALIIAAVVWLSSHSLANHWLHPIQLSRETTEYAIGVMGIAVALQWPSSFYASGLSGLERQPALNAINAVFATLRGAGVLAVLYWVSPTITAFMWWYVIVGASQSVVSGITLWRMLPANRKQARQFRADEFRKTGRFAGGLIAIMALSVALSQLDRLVISAMLPLVELGYFSLAMSVAAGMGRMVQPMFNALYPRYTRLVSLGHQDELTQLYHLSNQYLAVVVASVGMVLMFFSRDVLYLWTGDAAVAATVAVPLAILIGGTTLNGLMNLPYALQLANGGTRLTILSNLIALLLGLPFCIWAVGHHGLTGAACLWLGVNLGLVLVSIPLMHRRLMRGEMARWYLDDLLPPFAAAAAVAGCCRWLLPVTTRDLTGMLELGLVSALTLSASAMTNPAIRKTLARSIARALG